MRALLAAGLAQPDQVHVERRQGPGPGDAVLVGVLLDGGRGDPGRPDAVGAHPDRSLAPVLVQVGGAQGLGVARAQLEDVAHLDRRLDPDRPAVHPVAGLDAADVRALEGEVAARLHAAQVQVRPVAAGDVPAYPHALVEQDRDLGPHRPDEPRGSDPLRHLLGLC